MHQPGIEPGSVPWQGTILPLDHWCSFVAEDFKSFLTLYRRHLLGFGAFMTQIHLFKKYVHVFISIEHRIDIL